METMVFFSQEAIELDDILKIAVDEGYQTQLFETMSRRQLNIFFNKAEHCVVLLVQNRT